MLKSKDISKELMDKIKSDKRLLNNLRGNFSNKWDGQNYRDRREKNLNYRRVTEREREKYSIPEGNYYRYLGFEKDIRNQLWIKRKIKRLEGMIDKSKRLRTNMEYSGKSNIIEHYVYHIMGIDCYLFFKKGIIHEEELMKLLTWIPRSVDNRGVAEFGYNLLLSWIVEDIVVAYLGNYNLQKYGDDNDYNLVFVTESKGGTDLVFDRNGERYYIEVVEDSGGVIINNKDLPFRENKLPNLVNKSNKDNVIIVALSYQDSSVYALNLNNVNMKKIDEDKVGEKEDNEDTESVKESKNVYYYKTYRDQWKKNVCKIHKTNDSFVKVKEMDMDMSNHLAVV